jgi:hypothetical protein
MTPSESTDDTLDALVETDAKHQRMTLAQLYRKAKDKHLIKPQAQYT